MPGHEEANARTLGAAGAALDVPRADQVPAALQRMLGEPGLLERMAEAARRIGRPHAARTSAATVLRECAVETAA